MADKFNPQQDLNYELQMVLGEIEIQELKWGIDRVLPQQLWVTIAAEEFGEVARATLEHDDSNYLRELAQLAAVCISAIHSYKLGQLR